MGAQAVLNRQGSSQGPALRPWGLGSPELVVLPFKKGMFPPSLHYGGSDAKDWLTAGREGSWHKCMVWTLRGH